MMRLLATFTAALVFSGLVGAYEPAPAGSTEPASLALFAQEPAARSPEFLASFGVSTPDAQAEQRERCCKICTTGKACGNTCISREKQCHVGRGCACDG